MAKAQTVNEFMDQLQHPNKAAIEQLRQQILALDPAISEHIKWNAPSFCIDGDDRVTFRFPPKGRFQIIFHRGVATKDKQGFTFDDPSGLMDWKDKDRAVVSPATGTDFSTTLELINRWMQATR